MSGFLLDTHVWFWHLTASPRIAREAVELIDSSPGETWLSPISVWELGLLHRRGRVEIEGDFRRWVATSRSRLPLREALLQQEVALQALALDLPHRDPADHFLAATAAVYELTLITADRRLLDCAAVETVSARG